MLCRLSDPSELKSWLHFTIVAESCPKLAEARQVLNGNVCVKEQQRFAKGSEKNENTEEDGLEGLGGSKTEPAHHVGWRASKLD
jgi:hypothetical protein